MDVLKNKQLYINTIATFAIMLFVFWFIDSGFKLFKGDSFSQTFENYHPQYAYVGVAFVISFINLKRKTVK